MKRPFRFSNQSAIGPFLNNPGMAGPAHGFMASAAIVLLLLCGTISRAELPISGRRVETLTAFDALMKTYMESKNIIAGVLGVMKDGKIVYLRGFGYSFDGTTPLPENALFRLASGTKPITAAAARKLIDAGHFKLTDYAFNFDQANGGKGLDARAEGVYRPFPARCDIPYSHADITVDHLIQHTGGWGRTTAGPDSTYLDLTHQELTIANDMDIPSPPRRINTVRWILGKPLQNQPGDTRKYSNEGYLVLGLLVEQHSGTDLASYIQQNVLTPEMWVPKTEIQQGHTFRGAFCHPPDTSVFQDEREPRYKTDEFVEPVFDGCDCDKVREPYGGWDHEARIGQGGLIASAATMLEFLQRYHVGNTDPDVGQPLSDFPLKDDQAKNGAKEGVNTYAVQRSDGINVFIAFNKNCDGCSESYAENFYNEWLNPRLDELDDWPEETCDGFWIDPDLNGGAGVGGYNAPFQGVEAALDYVKDGSKLRFKGGTSTWTGTITTRVLMDAPHQTAIIGQE